MHVDQIRITLGWSEVTPLSAYLFSALHGRVAFLLEELLWVARRQGSPSDLELVRCVESLSDDSRVRLVSGGATFKCLRDFAPHRYAECAEQLRLLARAQLVIQNGELEASGGPAWTSDSGSYVPGPGNGRRTIPTSTWDSGVRFDAPRLTTGHVVDFDSSAVRVDEPRSGVLNGEFLPFTADEKRLILAKFEATIALIKRDAPAAGNLIQTFTRTMRVRKRAQGGHGSEQVPMEIGTIRLSNPHLPEVSPVLLAESLIHETIHNFLSAHEYLIGPFSPEYEFDSVARPISPWSDRPIPHASFTHAICVYYGLWCFLRRAQQHEDTPELRERIFTCASGFLQGPSINDFIAIVGRTEPRIAGLFKAMQQDVIAAERPLFQLDGDTLIERFRARIGA